MAYLGCQREAVIVSGEATMEILARLRLWQSTLARILIAALPLTIAALL